MLDVTLRDSLCMHKFVLTFLISILSVLASCSTSHQIIDGGDNQAGKSLGQSNSIWKYEESTHSSEQGLEYRIRRWTIKGSGYILWKKQYIDIEEELARLYLPNVEVGKPTPIGEFMSTLSMPVPTYNFATDADHHFQIIIKNDKVLIVLTESNLGEPYIVLTVTDGRIKLGELKDWKLVFEEHVRQREYVRKELGLDPKLSKNFTQLYRRICQETE